MDTVKTTVYLNADDYRRLKALAASQDVSAAELIRTAVSEYADRMAPQAVPKSLGAGASADGCLSQGAEELLNGFGEASDPGPGSEG